MSALVRHIPHPMPTVSAFVDSLRHAFGDETVDDAIRRGQAGETTFFAAENGQTVGTRSAAGLAGWVVDVRLNDRHFCPGCDGSCVGTRVHCQRFAVRQEAGSETGKDR